MQFREHSGDAATQIAACLAKGDRAGARNATHTLKGVAGNLSAEALYRASQKLETALRKNQADVSAELAELSREHETAVRSLEALKPAAPAVNGSAPDSAVLQKLLGELDRKLSGSDAAAVQALEAVKGVLHGSHPQFVTELERLIVSYDFEQARVRLAAFTKSLAAS
jgi:HPt (histidine-containing phosphotransfer) domain-containing protein